MGAYIQQHFSSVINAVSVLIYLFNNWCVHMHRENLIDTIGVKCPCNCFCSCSFSSHLFIFNRSAFCTVKRVVRSDNNHSFCSIFFSCCSCSHSSEDH